MWAWGGGYLPEGYWDPTLSNMGGFGKSVPPTEPPKGVQKVSGEGLEGLWEKIGSVPHIEKRQELDGGRWGGAR